MKKIICFVLIMALTFTTAASLVGCTTKTNAQQLTIMYFVGGFGDTWLKTAVSQFKAANPGVDVRLTPDDSLMTDAATYLQSGRNIPDIMMSQNLGWSDFVQNGYVESLEDVYNTDVKPGVTLKDYIVPGFAGYPYMKRSYNSTTERPWVIPWSVLTTGIAYNPKILASTTDGATGAKWTAPPATVNDLLQYCTDLNKAKIVPFSWPGTGINWLEFPQYVWWAQAQGVTGNGIDGKGNWSDFWDFASPNVYQQAGIAKSLDVLRSLIVDTKTQAWKNSIPDVDGKSTTDAERAFVTGQSAMIFGGGWLENEMRDFIPKGFTMKMMPTPLIDGAQINPATGKPYTINNADAGDVMFIPSAAKNIPLAKKFLEFIDTEKQMLQFTENTGMMRPFQYNPLTLAPTYKWTDYEKSTFDLFLNSDVNLYEYSKAKSDIYNFIRPELFQEVTVTTALSNLKTETGTQIMSDVYNKVAVQYPKWKQQLGLD